MIERINQIEIAEAASLVCGVIFLMAAIFFAFKAKIWHTIYSISGMKRKKGIRKLKREWLKTRVRSVLIGVLSGILLLVSIQMVYADTDEKGENDTIILTATGEQKEIDGIAIYNEGVTATVFPESNLSENKYIDENTIHIYGIPLDTVAKKTASNSDNVDSNSCFEILGWNITKKQGKQQLTFCFQEQGEWKLGISYQVITVKASDETEESNSNDVEETTKAQEELSKTETTDDETATTESAKESEKSGTTESSEESEEEKNQETENDTEEETDPKTEIKEYECCSDAYIVDRKPPEQNVSYENCVSISDAVSSPENVNRFINRNLSEIASSECEVFAGDTGLITVEIQEDYFSAKNVTLKIFEIFYENDSLEDVTKQYYKGSKKWEMNDSTATLQLKLKKEGHYFIQIEYTDDAGHLLTAQEGSETGHCLTEGKYEGPIYTIDDTKPVVETFSCQTNEIRTNGTRSYYRDPLDILIEVKEENFNQENFSLEDILTWADGTMISPTRDETDYVMIWTSCYENGVRVNQGRMHIDTEANHTLSVQVEDGSRLQSDVKKGEWTYDTTAPEIEITFADTSIYVPYVFYQYFSLQDIPVYVRARDKISGVWSSCYYFAQNGVIEDDQAENDSTQNEETGDGQNKQGDPSTTDTDGNGGNKYMTTVINENPDMQDGTLTEFSFKITSSQKNFKGCLYVQAEDFSGILGNMIQSSGMISESASLHNDVADVNIRLSEADYTDEDKKIKYYRQPVTVVASATDEHSGVAEIKLKASATSTLTEEETTLKTSKSYTEQDDITYSGSLTMEIGNDDFPDATSKNPICVVAVMTDNAGNKTSMEEEYKLVLDNTLPEIDVSYDINQAENEKYYNQTRVAKVSVRERNFDESAVEWDISGSNDRYTIGEWEDDGDIHQCEVVFAEEGDDYKLKISLSDYAGNKAVWDEDQAFCIDKTAPVLEMKMDSGDVKNEYYYASSKVLSFYVTDQHIDEESAAYYVNINEELSSDDEELPSEDSENSSSDSRKSTKENGEPLKLVSEGKDDYCASLFLEKDGEYQISFSCVDLAGNVSETDIPMRFVIDQTLPEIKVSGVENGATYTGAIHLGVGITDENIDQDTIRAIVKRIDGTKYTQMIDGERGKLIEDGKWQYRWEDIPHLEGMDGIYTLEVYAEDFAGNQISLGNEGILFYMNRFGISYDLGSGLKSAIEKGYINSEEDMIVTEYNVNPVENEVVVLKNNEERSVVETIGSGIDADTLYAEGKQGWGVKELLMEKENFQEEGIYQITIHSKGYAERNGKKEIIDETTNELEGQPIRFIVDKTPPVVQIGGLDQELYKDEIQIFTVTVMDNYEFAYMDVRIHYEGGRKEDRLIHIEADDLNDKHSIVEELEAYNGKQTIICQAWDKAGNCRDTSVTGESVSCVVTDNQMVQAYYEKPVVAWTWRIAVAGISVAGLLILAVILRKTLTR
ncbi:MAG: hypothetical protein LUF92_13755 [Clostridiales bacterium]|nr:hypothetical protein [Clostridiales bacterium]